MHGKIVYGTQFVAPRLCYAMYTKLHCHEFSSGGDLVVSVMALSVGWEKNNLATIPVVVGV